MKEYRPAVSPRIAQSSGSFLYCRYGQSTDTHSPVLHRGSPPHRDGSQMSSISSTLAMNPAYIQFIQSQNPSYIFTENRTQFCEILSQHGLELGQNRDSDKLAALLRHIFGGFCVESKCSATTRLRDRSLLPDLILGARAPTH